MNNDLEQLSENMLEKMAVGDIYPTVLEQAALARIALAAKQAKPDYYIVRLELNDGWGVEADLNAYESQLDASKCKDDHGGVIIPCYTTPQPAHTELNSPVIPDGWLAIPATPSQAHLNSIAMRYRHDFYLLNEAQKQSALATARQMYEECSGQGYFNIAAPKPESE